MPGAPLPPTLASAPTAPRKSREELVKLAREAARAARTGQPTQTQRADAASRAARALAGAFEKKQLTERQLKGLADMEEQFEACGGDVDAFCLKTGIDPKFWPVIRESLRRVEGGESMTATLEDTVKNLVQTAQRP